MAGVKHSPREKRVRPKNGEVASRFGVKSFNQQENYAKRGIGFGVFGVRGFVWMQ